MWLRTHPAICPAPFLSSGDEATPVALVYHAAVARRLASKRACHPRARRAYWRGEGGASWPATRPGRASHTTLETTSVEQGVRFYRDVMGLRTHRNGPRSGHFIDTRGSYAAFLERRRPVPQPLLNFYARPVADAASVDVAHARIVAVQDEYAIQEITAPAREDPAKFGVGTYGFYVKDFDGNW